VRLSQPEARVIGSLIEKQLTTPQQYPLTLNALLLACNQSSNRDPVVEYDERTVDYALTSLKAAGLVSFVHPSHGRSVTRYQQRLGEHLGITDQQLALLAVLLLRGPQTGGELRSRTERLCEFDGIAQVDDELELLSVQPEPLAAKMPRRPGQKEERWVQLLTDRLEAVPGPAPPDGASADAAGTNEGGTGRPDHVATDKGATGDLATEVIVLRGEVAELTAMVGELREQMETLRRDFYG
jgi:uncharacterized protein YceH (UPF0502 family)